MVQYETVFIGEPTMTEEEVDGLVKSYEQIATAAGGKTLKVEKWGKRRLAYPIQKQEEGVYVLMVLECPGTAIKELDRRYRMNDRIIRHLNVRVEHEAQLGPSPMVKTRPAERDDVMTEPAPAV